MKHITAIIVSPSPFVTAGIAAALGSMRDPAVTVIEADSPTLSTELARLRASVVIADPMLINHTQVDSLRDVSPWRPEFIAIHASALPHEVERAYDAAVSIYAPLQQLRSYVAKAAQRPAESDTSRELSPREKEVVKGIVKGLSNKEIAAEINISVNTVMTHRRNIASKLEIHSPAGLTIYALMNRLVKLEDVAP